MTCFCTGACRETGVCPNGTLQVAVEQKPYKSAKEAALEYEIRQLKEKLRELESDPRLKLTKEDLLLGFYAALQNNLLVSRLPEFGSFSWSGSVRRYQETVKKYIEGSE